MSILREIRSETSRIHVFAGTLAGTIACIAAALIVDSYNFAEMTPALLKKAIAVDILLPTVIGAPFFYFLLEKIRQLALARLELQHMASTDSLTTVLNRGALVMMVEAYLEQARAGMPSLSGSLLIVDADHFKSINDFHGHQAGDQALKLIAASIKRKLQGPQLLGRVGGEEFAVFLPNTVGTEAFEIAETIRQEVRSLQFPEDCIERILSVSIGGATFSQPTTYKELFKLADVRLYEAKASGRNLVKIGTSLS